MLAPPMVLRLAERDAVSTPVKGMLDVITRARTSSGTNIDTFTDAERRIACVITGTSAGLPCGDEVASVFDPKNLQRLVEGKTQCIRPISGSLRMAMLEKNVVHVKKYPGGKTERHLINSDKDVIKVAAQLGTLDLSASYGGKYFQSSMAHYTPKHLVFHF